MANLVFSLHISLNDAWGFSFPEYYSVCDIANPEKEEKVRLTFSEDELKQLEHLKTLA